MATDEDRFRGALYAHGAMIDAMLRALKDTLPDFRAAARMPRTAPMFLFRRLIDRALEWLSLEMERRARARWKARFELLQPQREAESKAWAKAFAARHLARPR